MFNLEKRIIGVDGMMCNHCVKSVTNSLKDVKGVTSVIVSLNDKNATITCKKDVNNEDLYSAITQAGFSVRK